MIFFVSNNVHWIIFSNIRNFLSGETTLPPIRRRLLGGYFDFSRHHSDSSVKGNAAMAASCVFHFYSKFASNDAEDKLKASEKFHSNKYIYPTFFVCKYFEINFFDVLQTSRMLQYYILISFRH